MDLEIFGGIASLTTSVAVIVAWIRKNVYRFEGVQVVILALVVGVLLAFVGRYYGYSDGDILQTIFLGLAAGAGASGGVELVRSFNPNSSPSSPGDPKELNGSVNN